MTDDKQATMKLIREKAIQETEKLATSQRFALFSSPVPLGLGDDSYDHKPIPPRNEMGKPITQPPNIKIKPIQQGKVMSSFFGKLGFTTIGDKYLDPDRRQRIQDLQAKKKYEREGEKTFVPPSGYKSLVGSAFPHEADFKIEPVKDHRDKDGRVIIAPRNPVTNPKSKYLDKVPPHMKDEYDRYHQAERERQIKEQKLIGEKAPFKSTVYYTDNFTKDSIAFGLNGTTPKPVVESPKRKPEVKDGPPPFKPANPAKSGMEGCIDKYPPYKGNPIEVAKRKEVTKAKDAFKPNNLGSLTRPTPSISCFPHNLKRELNSRVF